MTRVIVILMLLIGCNMKPAEPVQKRIVDKITKVSGSNGHTDTWFCLIAEDGTYASVDMVTYSKVKNPENGDCVYATTDWRK
jgi:hypothetical protein